MLQALFEGGRERERSFTVPSLEAKNHAVPKGAPLATRPRGAVEKLRNERMSPMGRLVFLVMLAWSTAVSGQDKSPTTLKGVLLEQLRTTHNSKDWFVSASDALAGLTPEQAAWRDDHGNHSIGQLVAHLVFWNQQQLAKFRGETPAAYSGDNNETFNSFDASKWAAAVRQLDEVMTALERVVDGADEAKLREWASTIAHIGTHNAYHIGQMVYIRRLQGSWDPEKGVK